MRPYTAAFIYASVVAGVVAAFATLDALDQSQRGYRFTGSFLLDVGVAIAFYFVAVFVLIARFPERPTRALLWFRSTFSLDSLHVPAQRVSFIVMCLGLAILTASSATYYLNGHLHLVEYWFTGRGWAPSSYGKWLWIGLLAAVAGLFGSFLYGTTVKPLIQWIRGEGTGGRDA